MGEGEGGEEEEGGGEGGEGGGGEGVEPKEVAYARVFLTVSFFVPLNFQDGEQQRCQCEGNVGQNGLGDHARAQRGWLCLHPHLGEVDQH